MPKNSLLGGRGPTWSSWTGVTVDKRLVKHQVKLVVVVYCTVIVG